MLPDHASEDEGTPRRTRWIIIFCAWLFALAIFWSVDVSFLYFLLAGCAFSLFKIVQYPRANNVDPKVPLEKPFETYRPSQPWLLWQEVKEIFRKDSSGNKTQQREKIFVALVAGFIGFIFFITMLLAFLGSDESNDDYYQQAVNYYNSQEYDSAAYFYKLAIDKDPDNPDLFFERGNAFFNANNMDSSLVMYEQTITLRPEHQQARYGMGYIYFSRKNYGQSIEEAKKLLEFSPDYVDAMLLLGDSFYNRSQLDSALFWYEDAYDRGFRSALLCYYMAYICDTKGEAPRAISLYKEALGQDSTIVEIYSRLGELTSGEEGNWYREKAARMK